MILITYPRRNIRKNAISFAKFKEYWKKEFGEPKTQREKAFINGKRGDYQRIFGFYDDYRTGNDSIKKYLKDIQK